MNTISKEVQVNVSADKAFDIFLNKFIGWWPKEYTWSQETLTDIHIEGKINGLCTEVGPNGFRCDWGRVTELVENKLIGLKWQVGPNREPIPNPEKASDIKIEFIAKSNGNTATLKLEHRNFENHGNGAEAYCKMMDSEQGWDFILAHYRKYCESNDTKENRG